jgi:formylglycine-generating enzyme required for sulfatase activity
MANGYSGIFFIPELVYIPSGTFQMGSNNDGDEEQPIHYVTVASFYMSRFVITQAQWRAVADLTKVNNDLTPEPFSKLNPQNFIGDQLPVVMVTWNDAAEFCARLSLATGRTFRLPSEAEWEYACRAGTTTNYPLGDEIPEDQFNCASDGLTPAGKYPPNAFGLYDMHGNVSEWCEDTWHDNYLGAPTNGRAWVDEANDTARVLRGGSWNDIAEKCRCASRSRFEPDFRFNFTGLRVVCS